MEGRLEVRKELAAGLTRLYEDRRRVRNGNRSRTTSPTAGIDTERSGRHDPSSRAFRFVYKTRRRESETLFMLLCVRRPTARRATEN